MLKEQRGWGRSLEEMVVVKCQFLWLWKLGERICDYVISLSAVELCSRGARDFKPG